MLKKNAEKNNNIDFPKKQNEPTKTTTTKNTKNKQCQNTNKTLTK